MSNGINLTSWFLMGLYAACLVAIATYHSRKLKRQEDVFLAGRSMSRWPIAISMYMAIFSTNTFLGTTGWVNRPDGTVWIGLQTIGVVFAVPVVVYLYPALFFRLRITTAYEYLQKRFNHSVRAVATIFFLGARIMWMSTILYSASLVVSMMLAWTPQFGIQNGQVRAILIIGFTAMLFALVGGMHAVIWTDVVQFFVLFTGVATMVWQGLRLSGGVSRVIDIANQFGKLRPPHVFSWTDEVSILSALTLGFFGMIASSGADQVLPQQYLTAKSEAEAKASLWRSGLFVKPISLIYPFLGLIMFAYYHIHPDIAKFMRNSDDALPVFVMNVLPQGARGLMIVAIGAAVLTSVQSGLTAVSAAIQVDYARRVFGRPLSDRESVILARLLLFVSGIVVITVACWVVTLGRANNIFQILNILMYPFSGVLLGIFLLGMLTGRANSAGTLIGSMCGFCFTIMGPISKVLFPGLVAKSSLLHSVGSISTFYYVLLATGGTVLAGYAASLSFPPPSHSQIHGLTKFSMPEPSHSSRSAAACSIRSQQHLRR